MPRYEIAVETDGNAPDPHERDLPDDAAAKRAAVEIASVHAADARWLAAAGALVVRVRAVAGADVATVRLACAVE